MNNIPQPPNTKGLPVEEAIARVRRFENQLTPEEFKLYRAEFLRKHRTKNILLGGAIMSGVIGVYLYSMYKTGKDDFSKLDDV